jgi:uncharacterized membrane protein
MSAAGENGTAGPDVPSAARMETLIGYILLIGVIATVILLSSGLLWYWLTTGSLRMDYTIAGMNLFEFVAAELGQVADGMIRPRLLVSLGIVALLLTPYLRVAASFLYFALIARDGKYAVFTGIVWSVLTYSLFLR